MGVLYDIYQDVRVKKRCTVCGCLMDADHEGDICEVCLDDMIENNDLEDQLSILLVDKEV